MNTANQPLTIVGNLNINTGGSLTMNTTNAALIVGGNVAIAGPGILSLSTVGNGYIQVSGNWTRPTTSTFTPNGRAVWFTGSSPQTISLTGTGTNVEVFNYLILNGTATVSPSNTAGSLTDIAINAATVSTDALQLLSTGGLDLNNRTLYMSSSVAVNIKASGGARSIGGTGTFAVQNATKTITSALGGTLSFGANVLVGLSNGIDFGVGLSTINGTLEIESGGFVITNAPIYGSGSLLKYNSATNPYGRGPEWSRPDAS